MAASSAPAVVQNPVVDDAAEDGTDLSAQGTAAQPPEDDTNHGANAASDGTGCHPESEASARTSERTGDTTGSAGQAAERAARALGDIAGFDAVGSAVGALKIGQGEEAPLQKSRWMKGDSTAKSPADLGGHAGLGVES